jgi:hypothetical protein
MKELADANHIPKLGANAQAETFEAATQRGRSIMRTGAVESQDADIKSQPVPRAGYVESFNAMEQDGRARMAAGRKGERAFPPARGVVHE